MLPHGLHGGPTQGDPQVCDIWVCLCRQRPFYSIHNGPHGWQTISFRENTHLFEEVVVLKAQYSATGKAKGAREGLFSANGGSPSVSVLYQKTPLVEVRGQKGEFAQTRSEIAINHVIVWKVQGKVKELRGIPLWPLKTQNFCWELCEKLLQSDDFEGVLAVFQAEFGVIPRAKSPHRESWRL